MDLRRLMVSGLAHLYLYQYSADLTYIAYWKVDLLFFQILQCLVVFVHTSVSLNSSNRLQFYLILCIRVLCWRRWDSNQPFWRLLSVILGFACGRFHGARICLCGCRFDGGGSSGLCCRISILGRRIYPLEPWIEFLSFPSNYFSCSLYGLLARWCPSGCRCFSRRHIIFQTFFAWKMGHSDF